MFMMLLVYIFTLFISFTNAYSVGHMWPYAKNEGGFGKLVAISGAVMTGIGFSMVIAMTIAGIGAGLHLFSHQTLVAFSHIFPALIIIPLVLSGFVITVQSWKAVFAKGQGGWERAGNVMTAGYNTYAQVENLMSMPGIFKKAFDNNDDSESSAAGLAIALIALLGGFLIAYKLINYFANQEVKKYMTATI